MKRLIRAFKMSAAPCVNYLELRGPSVAPLIHPLDFLVGKSCDRIEDPKEIRENRRHANFLKVETLLISHPPASIIWSGRVVIV